MSKVDTSVSVALTPEVTEILKQSHFAFSNVVKGKFGCDIKIHNVGEHTSPSLGFSKGTITPKVLYTKQLTNNLKISVWKDDLTKHKSDAVVNAANEYLSHGAGLALALCQAGGPQIQQWSNDHIKRYYNVPTGTAVIGSAGKLPCKNIIHAVGPQVSQSPTTSELENAIELLQGAVHNILLLSDNESLQSVAIPALSSGIFNFPRSLCADTIVKTVTMFRNAQKPGSRKMEVRLVNNDDPTVKEMLRACEEILGPSDSPDLSGMVQNQYPQLPQSEIKCLKLGNVTLHLKKGQIEQETTDVIVNSTGTDLKLSSGRVSQALFEKAGDKIQAEIKRKHGHQNAYEGEVIESQGYNLKCMKVYHTVCAHRNRPKSNQILCSVVKKCLENAYSQGFSSISFPALGTGNLDFRKDEVSQIMTNEVVQFANSHMGKQNKFNIYFVIFPKDTELLQAFKQEMETTEKKLLTKKNPVFDVGVGYRGFETAPSLSIYAESPEALKEAQLWINNFLHRPSKEVIINNNHVVHFGQKDHDKLIDFQTMFNVVITESFSNSNCGIIINGDSEAVIHAALEVENMLCQAQDQLAETIEREIIHWHDLSGSETGLLFSKTLLDQKSSDWRKISSTLSQSGLTVEKVEKIDNNVLKHLFQLKKNQVSGQPQRLYQRVKAQFCDLTCKVGFQREYAPPKEQEYGAGIYFTTSAEKATSLWPDIGEEFIYLIEAQVLTGNTERGSQKLILPPQIGKDPLVRYNSVTNKDKDIYVIFNGQQALPEFLITCRKLLFLSSV